MRALPNLRRLYASDNALQSIPLWLEDLPLRVLYLSHNGLEEFPPLRLPHLEYLFLNSNRLSSLPCAVKDYPLMR